MRRLHEESFTLLQHTADHFAMAGSYLAHANSLSLLLYSSLLLLCAVLAQDCSPIATAQKTHNPKKIIFCR